MTEQTVRLDAAGLDRRTFLRSALLGGSLLVVPGGLAACSRPNSSADAGSAASTPTGPASTDGELVFAVDQLTGSSDPGAFASFGNWMVIDCVARGLTHVDYETSDVKPALAESWTVSDDQRTYTFTIRSGVTFHDGNPVTAQDFQRSWRRLFDDKDPTRDPTTYASVELGGANVKSFKATDDSTFVVQLVDADVAFLARCSNPNSVALSSAAIEKAGSKIGQHLVGSGPYKFVSFTEGQSVILERNDDYWEGKPTLAKVVFQILPDPSSLVSALSSDAVNATCFAPVSNVPRLKNSGLVVADAKPYIDIYLGMNLSKPTLADLKVRQAINLAIDRQAVVSSVFAGAGAVPGGMVSPAELGYDDSLKSLSTLDVEKAKSLLTEAGAVGKEISVIAVNILFWPALGQVIEANLTAIGLKPKVEYLDGASYGDRATKNQHELFIEQRSAFVADPDNKLTPLIAGDSGYNKAWLHVDSVLPTEQKKLDGLLTAARGEPDRDKRKALYVEIQTYWTQSILATAMVAYRYLPTVQSAKVQGLNPDALGTYRTFFEKATVG
ncbi:ABC transporter substrate-binding protein [uncultured Friedmanniella sp.]|uniref:ABC transporter substrate-binding protein n=1 Tax=uncultured Friedmanniella sp. TaxID=335381 RepID=UPI0035C9A6D6